MPSLHVCTQLVGIEYVYLCVQGKAVGSLEGEDISCLAARDSRGEVALGRPDGRVQLWGVGEWTLRSTFHTSGGGCGAVLQYGSVGTKRESGGLPQIFLMVSHCIYMELPNRYSLFCSLPLPHFPPPSLPLFPSPSLPLSLSLSLSLPLSPSHSPL